MSKKLVIGTGISGINACELLLKVGEYPILFDSNESKDVDEIRSRLSSDAQNIEIIVGELTDERRNEIDEVILSPGVPIDAPLVNELRDAGKIILGEIELAFRYEKGVVLAISGTNGKTTTTSLLGKICADYFENAYVVGNIGNSYTGSVLNTTPDSVTVAEISSFQLETIHSFRPHVSALLNITPDHLNRHHTMEQYIIEKEKIASNQNKNDFIVLNYEDEELRRFGDITSATPIYFSSDRLLENGYCVEDGRIVLRKDGISEYLLSVKDLKIIGKHNVENAMAAIAMAIAFGIPKDNVINSTKAFTAVAHRIEYVAEINGVVYYNDSKGTNVDAAIKGIQAMDRPTCLIGGGYDKNADFTEWIESFDGKVKKLVLIGQTAQKIADCALKCGFNDYVFADTFEEALDICVKNAVPGDAVLLSPACASWGMFDNYEQRGDIFKELVMKME